MRTVKGDEMKTTCVTCYGSYEFLMIPSRFTNGPITFCNLMNDVLYDFLNDFLVVYLDDIAIYSKTFEKHMNHFRLVFQKLREHIIHVKKEKYKFVQRQIIFLGHKIREGLIKMDEVKVHSIRDWPASSKQGDRN